MSGERPIGKVRFYKVDKSRSDNDIDEIEVRTVYFAGNGFYVQLTPQRRENHGGYEVKTFDFWQVKAHKLLSTKRYTKKAEEQALEILAELESIWVAGIAASLGLVLEHDPVHGNW